MRRKDKEISDIKEILGIIKKCKYCHLGLCENNYPYVVTLNYGYSYINGGLTLYLHSALEGKKIDIIKKNNKACFEIICETGLIEADRPANFSFKYKSVIGFGDIFIINDKDEKTLALNYLLKHQTKKNLVYKFFEEELKKVLVYKIVVREFTGKQSPAKINQQPRRE